MQQGLVLLAIIGLQAQSVVPPDLEALTKIRTRMLFNLQHQPNYTCVETIERSSRAKSTNKLKVLDTLRLEVALVDGREMFAWPGSKKFEDFDMTRVITNGVIGTGDFSTHARELFATTAATLHFRGKEIFQGKEAIRFDYNVPRLLSHYSIRVAGASATVGYHGSFYADAQTFDVDRITVVADDLPPELHLTSARDQIDYAVAHIGEGDFLLPSESEVTLVEAGGGENRNHTKFTSCRQFTGDSVLRFDDGPPAESGDKPEAAPIPTREFELPERLKLYLVLTQQIDLKTAAIGDPVHARVDREVKQNGEMVIPKGALAEGRITRLEKYEDFSIVGVEFPEIDAPGMLAHMKGRLDNIVGIVPLRRVRSRSTLHERTPEQPGEGTFPVNASQRYLAKGCVLVWRT